MSESPLKQNKIVPIEKLVPHPRNYRQHPEAQVSKLVSSLIRFGQGRSIVCQDGPQGYLIVAGHGIVEAAKKLNYTELRADILPANWSVEDVEGYLIADNMHSQEAEDDQELLAQILQEQQDAGFDLASLGTDDETLRQMLESLGDGYLGNEGEDEEDDFDEAPDEEQTRVKLGDVWQLGEHRLLVGDCTKSENIQKLMQGQSIDAVISDPPYGISHDLDYTRFVGGVSPTKNKTKGILANDEKPFDPNPYLEYSSVVLWGANCYSNKLPLGTWLVWDKRFENGIAFLADAEVAWMKGGYGVYIQSITSQGFVRPEPVNHPTQKPIQLFIWCMEKAKVAESAAVLDPYLGSGTTLIACERTNRTCYGCELEPKYADVILKRWEDETGEVATLLERVEEASHV